MTPARRRRGCGPVEARQRLAVSRGYLDAAWHAAPEDGAAGDDAANNVATGNAVLAAIAASDAICCAVLGERSRDQDHRAAVELLQTVRAGPGDEDARRRHATELSRWLQQTLDLKDQSHYGVALVAQARLKAALRAASRLVAAAEQVLANP